MSDGYFDEGDGQCDGPCQAAREAEAERLRLLNDPDKDWRAQVDMSNLPECTIDSFTICENIKNEWIAGQIFELKRKKKEADDALEAAGREAARLRALAPVVLPKRTPPAPPTGSSWKYEHDPDNGDNEMAFLSKHLSMVEGWANPARNSSEVNIGLRVEARAPVYAEYIDYNTRLCNGCHQNVVDAANTGKKNDTAWAAANDPTAWPNKLRLLDAAIKNPGTTDNLINCNTDQRGSGPCAVKIQVYKVEYNQTITSKWTQYKTIHIGDLVQPPAQFQVYVKRIIASIAPGDWEIEISYTDPQGAMIGTAHRQRITTRPVKLDNYRYLAIDRIPDVIKLNSLRPICLSDFDIYIGLPYAQTPPIHVYYNVNVKFTCKDPDGLYAANSSEGRFNRPTGLGGGDPSKFVEPSGPLVFGFSTDSTPVGLAMASSSPMPSYADEPWQAVAVANIGYDYRTSATAPKLFTNQGNPFLRVFYSTDDYIVEVNRALNKLPTIPPPDAIRDTSKVGRQPLLPAEPWKTQMLPEQMPSSDDLAPKDVAVDQSVSVSVTVADHSDFAIERVVVSVEPGIWEIKVGTATPFLVQSFPVKATDYSYWGFDTDPFFDETYISQLDLPEDVFSRQATAANAVIAVTLTNKSKVAKKALEAPFVAVFAAGISVVSRFFFGGTPGIRFMNYPDKTHDIQRITANNLLVDYSGATDKLKKSNPTNIFLKDPSPEPGKKPGTGSSALPTLPKFTAAQFLESASETVKTIDDAALKAWLKDETDDAEAVYQAALPAASGNQTELDRLKAVRDQRIKEAEDYIALVVEAFARGRRPPPVPASASAPLPTEFTDAGVGPVGGIDDTEIQAWLKVEIAAANAVYEAARTTYQADLVVFANDPKTETNKGFVNASSLLTELAIGRVKDEINGTTGGADAWVKNKLDQQALQIFKPAREATVAALKTYVTGAIAAFKAGTTAPAVPAGVSTPPPAPKKVGAATVRAPTTAAGLQAGTVDHSEGVDDTEIQAWLLTEIADANGIYLAAVKNYTDQAVAFANDPKPETNKGFFPDADLATPEAIDSTQHLIDTASGGRDGWVDAKVSEYLEATAKPAWKTRVDAAKAYVLQAITNTKAGTALPAAPAVVKTPPPAPKKVAIVVPVAAAPPASTPPLTAAPVSGPTVPPTVPVGAPPAPPLLPPDEPGITPEEREKRRKLAAEAAAKAAAGTVAEAAKPAAAAQGSAASLAWVFVSIAIVLFSTAIGSSVDSDNRGRGGAIGFSGSLLLIAILWLSGLFRIL